MPRTSNEKVNILFVCTGNICRSPMAEAVFAQLVDQADLADRFEIASAAMGSWHVGESPRGGTLDVLRRHGVPTIAGKRAQTVGADMLSRADYIIAMDEGHARELRGDWKQADGKVSRLLDYAPDAAARDVPDPYYSGRYEEVYQLVLPASRGLLEHIRKEEGL